jgi:hypothetical protein
MHFLSSKGAKRCTEKHELISFIYDLIFRYLAPLLTREAHALRLFERKNVNNVCFESVN